MRVMLMLLLAWSSIAIQAFASQPPPPNPPTRLAVVIAEKTVRVHQPVDIVVELRDAYGLAVPAPKDYEVNIETWLSGQVTKRGSLRILRGNKSATMQLDAPGPGLVLVKATHPDLREDSAYIRTRPGKTEGFWWRTRSRSRGAFCQTHTTKPAVALGTTEPLDLILAYSDMGSKVTANGSDQVTITAFLSDLAPRDLKLRFAAENAQLLPNPLVIPAGDDTGETHLVTKQVGVVNVAYLGSNAEDLLRPPLDRKKEIRFDVAIKEIHLVASPPKAPLGDSIQLVAEFLGLDGNPVQLPEARLVNLTLESGLGVIEPNPISIAANSAQGFTKFTPRKNGQMQISATSYGARSRAPITVSAYLPITMALIIFVLGSAACAVRLLVKPVSKRAALIGAAVGGFSALGICGIAVFGLYKFLPPSVALHPLGACSAAILIGLGVMKVTI